MNVKSYYGNVRDEVEGFLKTALDGVTTDAPFGAVVSYHKLFRGLESLPCVDSLRELNISAQSRRHTRSVGIDIALNDDALYYAGQITLEIVAKG